MGLLQRARRPKAGADFIFSENNKNRCRGINTQK
jgi:hypothetical protein